MSVFSNKEKSEKSVMSIIDQSVLFLGKEGDEHCARALSLCRKTFTSVESHLGGWGDPLPAALISWNGNIVISYLSRWVVPAWLLKRANVAALNFHPAPPEYPGIGCINFALYHGVSEFGATCHHMETRVDTGKIVAVKRFPVSPQDDVASLLAKTYDHQLALFKEIISGISEGNPLPSSDVKWHTPAYTREQLNELSRITPGMSKVEIAKRIRATTFGKFKPFIELGGYRFELATSK